MAGCVGYLALAIMMAETAFQQWLWHVGLPVLWQCPWASGPVLALTWPALFGPSITFFLTDGPGKPAWLAAAGLPPWTRYCLRRTPSLRCCCDVMEMLLHWQLLQGLQLLPIFSGLDSWRHRGSWLDQTVGVVNDCSSGMVCCRENKIWGISKKFSNCRLPSQPWSLEHENVLCPGHQVNLGSLGYSPFVLIMFKVNLENYSITLFSFTSGQKASIPCLG